MFSVIIPLYNKEATIRRALQSILDQTIQEFEVIVVNDGSNDNGPNVVKSFMDPRICLIHQKNQGASAARNRGVAEAKHELIAFLDADDWWRPFFLETIKRLYMLSSEIVLCATAYEYYIERQGENLIRYPQLTNVPTGTWEGVFDDYFAMCLNSDPPVCSSSVSVKKSALEKAGGFDEDLQEGEDLLTWAKLACIGLVAYSTIRCATWYKNYDEDHSSQRKPDIQNIVGKQIRELRQSVNEQQLTSLRSYEAAWYINLAIVFLQRNMCTEARHNAVRAMIVHHSAFKKAVAIMIISLMPFNIIKNFFTSRKRRGK